MKKPYTMHRLLRAAPLGATLWFALASASAQVAPATPTTDKPNDVVTLSPFEVVSDNKGYYATSTMSGTRFNTKLEDLASSITIVTKEQMEDFAMVDMNDIFQYTANTEGANTYTPGTGVGPADRNGSVADNVQIDPNNANRIRGIGSANVSLGNIESMNRVPTSLLTMDAVEISRGPNANVFGLGNPSGTVNQVPAAANLSRNRSNLTLRVDSWGGSISTLDLNRVLLPNKLALRFNGGFQHDAYTRKPSGTNTVRYDGMVKFAPFKKTTLSASMFFYRMNGNRPNTLPPRDNISYWVQNGKPTWDPVTSTIHVNGKSIGPVTMSTAQTLPATFAGQNIDYFSTTLLGGNRSQMFIDQGGLAYWAAPTGVTGTTPNPTGSATTQFQSAMYVQTTGTAGATGTAAKPSSQPLFVTTPTISDKSIYNWEDINLSAPNRLMEKMVTTILQWEQMFVTTQQQTLAAQAVFMREDSSRFQRNLLGIANDNGQSGQLEIDVNERLLDGTPNPFFMRPFVGTDKPRTVWAPAKWDTGRAQIAYRFDFAQNRNWTRWLGLQQFTAYDEYKYRVNRQYSFRDAIIDAHPWIPAGTYRGTQAAPAGTPAVLNVTSNFMRYYVGDTNGTNVDYAPGNFNAGIYPYVWGNAATGVFNRENAQLGYAAADKSNVTDANQQTLKTAGAVWQGHFLNDAVVVTLGRRQDKVYSKFGSANLAYLNADGVTFDPNLIDAWRAGDYGYNRGTTNNVQYVVRPFRDATFVKSFESQGDAGRVLAGALRGLSLFYNRSTSFVPATPAQDLFLNVLPNPTGEDKSFGVGLNLFDGKAVLRFTRYRNAQLNSRNSDANTTAQRVIRTDMLLVGATPARFVLQTVAGSTAATSANNNTVGWIKQLNPTWTDDQVTQEFYRQSGLSAATVAALTNPNPPIGATNDVIAQGSELELNLNLTPNWTLAASATDTQAYIRNVSSTLQKWIDQRMAVWTTLVDQAWATSPLWTDAQRAAEPQHLWWTHNYGGTQTAQQNFIAFVSTPYSVIKQLEGQANPQIRRYNFKVSTNYRLAGWSDNKWLKNINVGGAIRWEDKAAIGFYGKQTLPAMITDLDVSRPIYDSPNTYLDAFIGYRTKIWRDKVGATIRLNAENFTEGGRLQPIAAYPDGSINTYRIVDPRKFVLSVSFDM